MFADNLRFSARLDESYDIMLASLIELCFGLLKLSKIADVVTEPVIAGFLNAFAIFLVKSQVSVSLPGH